MNQNPIKLVSVAAALVAAGLIIVSSAHAQSVWDGGNGTNSNWSSGDNWVGDTAPISGASLQFGGTTRTTNTNDQAGRTYALAFTNNGSAGQTGNFTLSGNDIILGGNIITTQVTSGTLTDTIDLNLQLNANREIHAFTNHRLVINGNITQDASNRQLVIRVGQAGGGGANGKVTLNGNNSYAGGTKINFISGNFGLTVVAGSSTAFGTGWIELQGTGAVVELANGVNLANQLTNTTVGFAKSIVLQTGATSAEYSGNIVQQEPSEAFIFTSSGSGTLTVSGVISSTDTGTIAAAGNSASSVVVFSNSNTYTGNTTIDNGVLRAANNQAFGTSGNVSLISTNATLELANTISINRPLIVSDNNHNKILRLQSGASSGTYAGNITISETTLGNFDVSADTGGTLLVSGNIGGAGGAGLSKEGTGTVVLSGTNSYTGATAVNAGTLVFRNTAAKTAATATAAAGANIGLGVGAGGDYTDANVADLFNTNTLAGFSLNATSGVAIDTTGGNFTQSTALTANRSLTKLGTNTLTLSGNSTYGGTTTVTAGTLLINGNNSGATGAVSVASGATLGGNGTVGGATTIRGNLQPGNSPDLLIFSSSLTLNSTATTTMEINVGTGAIRGTDYDGINVGTSLTYGGNLTLDIGTIFGVGTYSWNLFDSTNSPTGSFATGGVTLTDSYTGPLVNDGLGVWTLTQANGFGGNNTWTFTQSTGDLGLSVIPEPSAWILLTGSLTALALIRRRRS